MIPFKDTYYENKLKEYNDKCNIKNNTSVGNFYIDYVFSTSGRINAYMHSYRGNFYSYPELKEGEDSWMAVSPVEIGGCFEASRRAHGKVGVIGLGLGYFVQEILDKEKVEEVIVYELSSEVIELYNMNFGSHPKLKLIKQDAFKVKNEDFDYFFVDIYRYMLQPQIVEDYKVLNKNLNIKEYVFWGVEHFLLSCDSEDVKNANLPKLWISMADSLGDRFYQSKYKENFVSLDFTTCREILNKFKEIFNK